MDVTSDGKWFWVEPASGPTATAAERILALRMEDVERSLPLAARHEADDVEYVHQLRVSCRRAAAALRAFQPLAPREAQKLKRWLQRLRRAAGPARDADVLAARLRVELDPANAHAQQLVAVIAESRARAQRALVKADAKAARGGFQRAIDRCVRGFGDSDAPEAEASFAEYARLAVGDAAEQLDVVDAHAASLPELHQLRIAAKRLRYAIEIFHSAAEPALRHEAYPQVEELQERLGAINDRAASQLRFQRWLGELPPDDLAAFVAERVVAEHAVAVRLRGEFLRWWTPERQASLRELLAGALA